MPSMLAPVAVLAIAGTAILQQPVNPFGEPKRVASDHVTVAASVSPTSVEPGGRLRIDVTVTPRRAIHVYAPGKHGYKVVQLTLDAQPWMRADPTKYPPSTIYYFEPLDERVEVYSTTFRVSREVTMLATPEARKAIEGRRSVTLTGALEYQACDDKVCYQPSREPFSVTVNLRRP
jgi:hypothetical protein